MIASSVPNLRTGTKWDVSESVVDAESILHFKKVAGHTQTGRAGLGYMPSQQVPEQGTREYRKAVSDTVADVHGKAFLASEEGKALHNNWMAWSNYIRNDLTWKCMWVMPPSPKIFLAHLCNIVADSFLIFKKRLI